MLAKRSGRTGSRILRKVSRISGRIHAKVMAALLQPDLFRNKPAAMTARVYKGIQKGGMMKIVMLGAPGAGKGTQADRIAEKFGIPHISTGDIFRANLREGTELGKKAKVYMDRGELVPDDLTCDLLIDRVSKEDCAEGYILDGFPRTIAQAEVLDRALKALNTAVDFAIDVEVPDEDIVTRMSGRRACPKCGATYHVKYMPSKIEDKCDKCGSDLILRDDDKPETVLKRLRVYHDQTQPLIDYYQKKGILHTVDGTKTPEAVFGSILAFLGKESV